MRRVCTFGRQWDGKGQRPLTTGSPHPAGVLRIHGLTLFAAEGFAELVEVLHGAIHAPLSRRMGIGKRPLARRLLCLVLAPYLGEPDKVALLFGVAVNLVLD